MPYGACGNLYRCSDLAQNQRSVFFHAPRLSQLLRCAWDLSVSLKLVWWVQRAGWIHVQFAGHAWSCMAMHLFDHELLSVFLLNNVLSDFQTLGFRNKIIPSHRSMGIQITLPLLFLAKFPRKLRIQQPLWAQNGIQRHHPITIPSSASFVGSDHSHSHSYSYSSTNHDNHITIIPL